MGVNHRHGYNKKTVEKMGKLFTTIDFERNDHYSAENFRKRDKSAVCGSFFIGGREFRCTIQELKKIEETAKSAQAVVHKAYKIGLTA